ncbi:hypothetical protein GCM10010166_55400 [Couchioplanes caeruleus subsp. azureus]|nr:hypothetical protein GCM10010166_55400 [Couchioplanes caeruleus subsp. azureus]
MQPTRNKAAGPAVWDMRAGPDHHRVGKDPVVRRCAIRLRGDEGRPAQRRSLPIRLRATQG